MVSLGYVTHFDAAHSLPGYDGKCSKLHGHTWKVEIKISGQVENGNLIDFTLFKEICNRVVNLLDHSHINKILVIPTAENISQFIWDGVNFELTEAIQRVAEGKEKNGGFENRVNTDVHLTLVRVWESENCYAERVRTRVD